MVAHPAFEYALDELCAVTLLSAGHTGPPTSGSSLTDQNQSCHPLTDPDGAAPGTAPAAREVFTTRPDLQRRANGGATHGARVLLLQPERIALG